MFNDPIVAETRKLREEYAARFDFDLAEICRDLREQQARGDRPVIETTDLHEAYWDRRGL